MWLAAFTAFGDTTDPTELSMAHDEYFYMIRFSSDGKILVAVGDDGFVRFWNTKTHELLAESKTDKEGLYSVVFTPDQTRVITGGVRGKLYECPVPHLDAKDGASQRNFDQEAVDAPRP